MANKDQLEQLLSLLLAYSRAFQRSANYISMNIRSEDCNDCLLWLMESGIIAITMLAAI